MGLQKQILNAWIETMYMAMMTHLIMEREYVRVLQLMKKGEDKRV